MILGDLLPPPASGERTFTLADRRADECAWPVDRSPYPPPEADMSRRPFCCAAVKPGSIYCPGHHWDAYPGDRHGRPRP